MNFCHAFGLKWPQIRHYAFFWSFSFLSGLLWSQALANPHQFHTNIVQDNGHLQFVQIEYSDPKITFLVDPFGRLSIVAPQNNNYSLTQTPVANLLRAKVAGGVPVYQQGSSLFWQRQVMIDEQGKTSYIASDIFASANALSDQNQLVTEIAGINIEYDTRSDSPSKPRVRQIGDTDFTYYPTTDGNGNGNRLKGVGAQAIVYYSSRLPDARAGKIRFIAGDDTENATDSH